MRILTLADKESPYLWDYYTPGKLDLYDMILACGDLDADYLSFLVTMSRCPVFYVHGNHDEGYETQPPEGCDCIDGKLVIYRGVRILGLGGSVRYRRGAHQYSQLHMAWRVLKKAWPIYLAGGVDMVVTHAPPRGVGDMDDPSHQGFRIFLKLLERCQPRYLFHGHVHMNYGHDLIRIRHHKDTRVVNCWEKYALEIPQPQSPPVFSPGKRLFIQLFAKNLVILDP